MPTLAQEISSFAVALVLLPLIVSTIRQIRSVPAARWLLVSVFALYGAMLFNVVEDIFWPTALNLAQHVCYAVGGLAFGLFALAVRSRMLREGELG